MIEDFATNPKQRNLFKKFRDLIMGVIPIKNNIKERETNKKSK